MFLLCLPSFPLRRHSCHVFIGRQANIGLRRSRHIGRDQAPLQGLVDDRCRAADTWCRPWQVKDLATAGSGTAAAGAAAQGGTDDGDDSLGQGGEGEDEEDEGEGEIGMDDHDGVDDAEDELGGGEQGGDDAEDQEGADVAGGGLAASDNTEDAGDEEEDAAVDSLAGDDVAAVVAPVVLAVLAVVIIVLHMTLDDDADLTEDGDGAEDNLKDGEILGCLLSELFLRLVVLPVDDDVNRASLGSDSGGGELLLHLCTTVDA